MPWYLVPAIVAGVALVLWLLSAIAEWLAKDEPPPPLKRTDKPPFQGGYDPKRRR